MEFNKIEEMFLLAIRLHSMWVEVWLPVSGYPNYEVSSAGRVRNLKTKRIMKQTINKGYHFIGLRENGQQDMKYVHRLVCSTFNLNPQRKSCVDHIDNNKSNNHVKNLRFATHSQNQMNKSKLSNNKSGTTGVFWFKAGNKWRAQITIKGVQKHLGNFGSIVKAKSARIKAVNKLFGSYANKKTNK